MPTSTFQQFIETFKKELSKVAEFEEEPDQTLSVITGALESSRIKELLDELDRLRASSDNRETEEPAKRAVVPRANKKAPVVAAQVATVDNNNETVEESKGAKPKRVTGYNVFVAEQVKEKKQTMKDAAAAWKVMDDESKRPYNARATAQNQA